MVVPLSTATIMSMDSFSVPGLAFKLDPAQLSWRETKVTGVGWIPLYLEGEGGPQRGSEDADGDETEPADAAVLIRMDPGCGYPRHVHLDVEEVLCLSGGYADELGTVREGDYVRYEAGSAHAPVALPGNPCVLFASARGGIRIVE